MQRNRKQEKANIKDKNIKDNNIEVIVNIGNENNDESEKNSKTALSISTRFLEKD